MDHITMSSLEDCLPYYAEGTVVSGFGRGSKELGIPTANFPEEVVKKLPENLQCGVYYGWAKISSNENVFKMTMSIGWNPFYHNTVKTMETHILHKFENDFYGDNLKVIILGYIRAMLNFKSLDDLITAIKNDISVSDQKLEVPELNKYKDDIFFKTPHKDQDLVHLEETNSSVNSAENSASIINHVVSLNKDPCDKQINGTNENNQDCKETFQSNLNVKNSANCQKNQKFHSSDEAESNCRSFCHSDQGV